MLSTTTIVWSVGAGVVAGLLYGLFFLKSDLAMTPQSTSTKQIRKEKFFTFFLMATLRVLVIALLWYYVLRSSSLNIILVLVAFLIGFWAVILKKKVLHE